jgi:hypothetical protein
LVQGRLPLISTLDTEVAAWLNELAKSA